ncbi:hypothetical protein Tco_0559987, partial [Tanacetum coccineum]
YLKHQPKLGLWYPRDSPFELEAFSDSDYEGASLDRKSTTCGCQFLGRRLISWQCKKQMIVASSTTKATYVAAANCFKNLVYHSRTKHIEIRHHFIRDCYEKRLIDVIKIHTDANVADLLTKGFDVRRINFLVEIKTHKKITLGHATTQDSKDSLEETNGNEGDQVQTPHDSPLSGGHTSDRAEGALNLQGNIEKVLALESIKDAQAAEISALKSRIKKLEKKCKPSISHHRAWLKSVKRLSMKKRFGKKESVSKQGRKKSKPESTLDDSTVFDDQDAYHDDIEVVEDKGNGDKKGNVKELVSIARPEVITARPDVDATRQEDSVVEPRTPPTTTNVDDSSRPERSILTLKPLPTIDPKDKGKGVLKESPVKKVKRSDLDAAQIAKDVGIARLIHKKELAEMEREREERQRQDQASMDYILGLYDEVQAKMDASEELATSAASTPIGVNTSGSSYVYLGGQIPIDASTLPNVDLPIDPNMPDLEDDSNVFPNDGIFSGAYDDEDVGTEAAFNNMDNTIDVSPTPTLRVHKDHPKGQILGDPKSAVQTRGKIQKASSV